MSGRLNPLYIRYCREGIGGIAAADQSTEA